MGTTEREKYNYHDHLYILGFFKEENCKKKRQNWQRDKEKAFLFEGEETLGIG